MKRALKQMLFGASLIAVLPYASAASFESLYVFGDSLSDSGNTYNTVLAATAGTVVFPPPPNNRRGSNGLVAAEYLANSLGFNLQPSTAGGTNYAYYGAATGAYTVPNPLPPGGNITSENINDVRFGLTMLRNTGIGSQVTTFLGDGRSFDASSTLFMVWGGPNDFFLKPEASTVPAAITNLSTAITRLVQDGGARKILVPNLPDLGATPAALLRDQTQPGSAAVATFLSAAYNQAFNTALNGVEGALKAQYSDLEIFRFDTFAALSGLIANAGAAGITNTTAPCHDLELGIALCANPDEYLFWDSVHPTDKVHRILGDQFAAAVPEPETYALMLVGVLFLVGVARSRR